MTLLSNARWDDITLTPEQIRARTFSSEERGYDRREVDSFLAQVAADYQAASAAIDVTGGAHMDPADSATESAAAALERGLDELDRAVAEVARTGARALALTEEANRRMAKAEAPRRRPRRCCSMPRGIHPVARRDRARGNHEHEEDRPRQR
jgi:DivIVA domain-containing protein